jgi:2-polyprenyl-3-methyl-5-hydroxy-6-metoxy-1,4-benzoquinol methylase
MKKKLANKSFWDNYWKNLLLTKNYEIDQEKDIFYNICKIIQHYRKTNFIKNKTSLKVLEIGGARGNILKNIYLFCNCKIASLDFSRVGNKFLSSNLSKENIKPYKIITADLFTYKAKREYDIVYSLGFVEHFSQLDVILKLHLKFLKNEGVLIIGFPDLTNINGVLLKYLNKNLYEKHSIKIMEKSIFQRAIKKINCKLISFQNISGYEPNMISYERDSSQSFLKVFFYKLAAKILHLLKKIYLFKIFNIQMLNSYRIVVIKKNNNF